MDFKELASSRRSIRKYKDIDVDINEVIDCVKIATTAPSGCNSQCWEFVVIHSKQKLEQLAEIVAKKQEDILSKIGMERDQGYLEGRIKMLTFFKNAPVCVAVFMTQLDYYDKKMEGALRAYGYSHEDMMSLYGNPDLLSIGAAVQNLLLALHEKGYGACWMNDPVIAADEISSCLEMGAGEKLISLVPIGLPAYTPRAKAYKPIDEVLRIIE